MKPETTMDLICYGTGIELINSDGTVQNIPFKDFMKEPQLSLNARLAIAFDGFTEAEWSAMHHNTMLHTPDYESDNLAAFSLLEKAKQDGKIMTYNIWQSTAFVSVSIWVKDNFEVSAKEKTVSKAITQALAYLLPDETPKTCPRCKEQWDEAGGCRDPECPCDKS